MFAQPSRRALSGEAIGSNRVAIVAIATRMNRPVRLSC